MRVIADDGAQVGIIPTSEALRMAQEKGLDLVEVAPNAEPPVCRIMDFGRFKYQQQKKLQEARKKAATVQLKEIKVRPKTDEHDYQTKLKHIRRFSRTGTAARSRCFFAAGKSCTRTGGRIFLPASSSIWGSWPVWSRSRVPRAA